MSVYEFYWERAGDGVRLLRAHGSAEEAVLPEQIAGLPLREIGPYCFAGSCHLPEHYERITVGEDTAGACLHELSGRWLKTLSLPDTVGRTGNLAFMNCTELTALTVGSRMEAPGSDAFMNCRKLRHLTVRCGIGEKSGLRQILSRISQDLLVTFQKDGEPEAELYFPEYYESYDEIAPAHLFGRSIVGEGFRARQCFREGIADLAQYDRIFPRACAEESVETLCRIALCRLRSPAQPESGAAALYETYLCSHAAEVCRNAVRGRDTGLVRFLCSRGLAGREHVKQCVLLAVETGWAEGAASFLRIQDEFFPRKTAAERYSFDDF